MCQFPEQTASSKSTGNSTAQWQALRDVKQINTKQSTYLELKMLNDFVKV